MALKLHLALSLFSCVLASVSFLKEKLRRFTEYSFVRVCFSLSISVLILLSNLSCTDSSSSSYPLHCLTNVVDVTILPSRFPGFVQLYLFLCTRLDRLPLVSPAENLSRYEQILLILPAVLVLVLFIINSIFLIIMFKL